MALNFRAGQGDYPIPAGRLAWVLDINVINGIGKLIGIKVFFEKYFKTSQGLVPDASFVRIRLHPILQF